MKKNPAVSILFGLASLVNPNLACSSNGEDEDFTYSEQDMKAVVLGDWQGTAVLDGESVAFSLSLEQASAKSGAQSVSPPPFQPQCGSRSFVKPAAACVSESTMSVTGNVTSEHPMLNGALEGYAVASRILNPSELHLELEDGTRLNGNIKDQSISEGEVFADEPLGTFNLSRP
jgi:hypothetical protein